MHLGFCAHWLCGRPKGVSLSCAGLLEAAPYACATWEVGRGMISKDLPPSLAFRLLSGHKASLELLSRLPKHGPCLWGAHRSYWAAVLPHPQFSQASSNSAAPARVGLGIA